MTDTEIKYERFKELLRKEMPIQEAMDRASGYQMYSYPEFNDRTDAILNKCTSIDEAIGRFLVEDPDGWMESFLQQLAEAC